MNRFRTVLEREWVSPDAVDTRRLALLQVLVAAIEVAEPLDGGRR